MYSPTRTEPEPDENTDTASMYQLFPQQWQIPTRQQRRRIVRTTIFFGALTMITSSCSYLLWRMMGAASPSIAHAAAITAASTTPSATTTVTAAAGLSSNALLPVPLDWRHVLRASLLMGTTAGVGLWVGAGVPEAAQAVFAAWGRSAVQLYWFGGLLLTQLLSAGHTRPWLVFGWIALTCAVAAQEAMTRVAYTYPQLARHVGLAIAGGAGGILACTLALTLLGPVDPWFAPRTWIPLSGMVLGNALTGTALAAKTITQEMAVNRDQVELRLSQGATWREAVRPLLQTVYITSLTPIMNFLSAAGIVHIPGLMTGQILAGQAPLQAATYQVVVFAIMASCVCLTVQLLTRLSISTLVDQPNDRLRLDALIPVDNRRRKKRHFVPSTLRIVPEFCSAVKYYIQRESRKRQLLLAPPSYLSSAMVRGKEEIHATALSTAYGVSLVRKSPDANSEETPILSANKMRIARTQMDVTLDVRYGDRIALTGRSGIGKSLVLKTLAGLEPVNRESLQLVGTISANSMSMAQWRSHVMLVPQKRPTLEGTPNQFYQQVTSFASQKKKNLLVTSNHTKEQSDSADNDSNINNSIAGHRRSPSEYCAEWGLAPEALNQPWSTLSGGESQRAVLAIALALQPGVLLLDESTSALDDKTARLVEATLKKLRIPLVMVSHSAAQVDRFCNQRINLNDRDVRQATMADYDNATAFQ